VTDTLVDVVLPCLNEERAIVDVLRRLPAGYRGIVVDNGSTDRSAELARAAGALVVTEPRRGFGSAAHAGLLAATAPLVAFCDADGSMDPAELLTFAALIEGAASRRPVAPGPGTPASRTACSRA
jgi:glycosyltransferase involved in cell wall biosynthesis